MSHHLFGLLMIVVIAWMIFPYCSNEQFTGRYSLTPAKVTVNDYIRDVQIMSAPVGNYIGGIYVYLRSKMYNSETGKVGPPAWKPFGPDDPNLLQYDYLYTPKVRVQIKSYLDSEIQTLKNKYPANLRAATNWSISYKQNSNGTITVNFTQNGKSENYYV
jgi:hypothetical protein